MEQLGLIADIGGTNARFALTPIRAVNADGSLTLKEADLIAPQALDGASYATIADAAEAYLAEIAEDYGRPEHAVMAIACPTDQDQITMTNHFWSFSVKELKAQLKLKSLSFINDYNAMANCIPQLDDDGLIKIGRGEAQPGKPIAVTGPGTGLGLAALAFSDYGPVTLETEGGHTHFAPTNLDELEVLTFLLTKFERVSQERLLSGQGLENIYQALAHGEGKDLTMAAKDISAAALAGSDALCLKALSMFCAVLGGYAGDVALAIGAKGGVYITGGIIPRFIDFFKSSEFRARFESKGRLSGFVETIPTYVVVSKQPGLLGAAAVLNRKISN
ncbi:glucokinase [Reinekea marinisedimentorum]|uniref:Glucokinase n=1 Tax=Reinekea marinisedimentorum TaxID=230495 RepID=A0A4R3I352_9GAMM|nr:glucokinase [Reinekea marinisedimentorum]TCS40110.1 glucokinase [Reinekea marinisedimentorum]